MVFSYLSTCFSVFRYVTIIKQVSKIHLMSIAFELVYVTQVYKNISKACDITLNMVLKKSSLVWYNKSAYIYLLLLRFFL